MKSSSSLSLFAAIPSSIPVSANIHPADEILTLVMQISVAEAEKTAIDARLKDLNDKLVIAQAKQAEREKEEKEKADLKREEEEKLASAKIAEEKAHLEQLAAAKKGAPGGILVPDNTVVSDLPVVAAPVAVADEKQIVEQKLIDEQKQKALTKYYGISVLAFGYHYKSEIEAEKLKPYKTLFDTKLNDNPKLLDLAVALEDFIVIGAENKEDKFRFHLSFYKSILKPGFDVKDKLNAEIIDNFTDLLKALTKAKKDKKAMNITIEVDWFKNKTTEITHKILNNTTLNPDVKSGILSLFRQIIEDIKVYLGLKIRVENTITI